jgi:hypothetical protein
MKKNLKLEEDKRNKLIGKIARILAIFVILAYLISMFLNTSAPGYDSWIGKPIWWK